MGHKLKWDQIDGGSAEGGQDMRRKLWEKFSQRGYPQVYVFKAGDKLNVKVIS